MRDTKDTLWISQDNATYHQVGASPSLRRHGTTRTARRHPRYCVIGAGAAGLAAMRALRRTGSTSTASRRPIASAATGTPTTTSLHLITPRSGSGFRGDPMPAAVGRLPEPRPDGRLPRGLRRPSTTSRAHVRFGTRVERLVPLGRKAWTAGRSTTSDGVTRPLRRRARGQRPQLGPGHPERTRQVQRQEDPLRRVPQPADIEGPRVLVVGSGNSAATSPSSWPRPASTSS